MVSAFPVRLGAAETALIEQLQAMGATAAAERLAGAGLPTRRVESYHYTDLKTLLRAVPPLSQTAHEAIPAGQAALPVAGAFTLTIANGRVQNAATPPAGVTVGRAEGGVLSARDDVLVHLNGALAREALTLTLDSDIEPVLQIERRIAGASNREGNQEAVHVADALKVFVTDGASAVIFEVFSGSDAAHVGNHGTYMALGKNAVVTHVTLDLSPRAASHFATNEYRLADGARLRTLTIHAGAGLSRSQIYPTMAGAGAHADLTGLNLVSHGQHADITMETVHAVPHTSSQPLFKSIARDRSRSVVQGKLVVARDAQKTDAKFMHQGLMLSDEAEILSKPELEIYADDVVCGHGSTCGMLDEESLFYLMSRGIPKAEAETMLIRGFIAELLDPVENGALSAALRGVVENWLLAGRE